MASALVSDEFSDRHVAMLRQAATMGLYSLDFAKGFRRQIAGPAMRAAYRWHVLDD
jgi:hypothetical protein